MGKDKKHKHCYSENNSHKRYKGINSEEFRGKSYELSEEFRGKHYEW